MSFSELPLDLAQDILDIFYREGPTLQDLVALRLVNSFFEQQITRYIARSRVQGQVAIVDKIPRDFQIRLLSEYFGDGDRRSTHFASKVHAVVDLLATRLKGLDRIADRQKVIEMVCEALVDGEYHYRFFGEEAHLHRPNKAYVPSEKRTIETSVAVAVILQDKELVEAMFKNHPVDREGECRYLGSPMARAIASGDVSLVRCLSNAGVTMTSSQPEVRHYTVCEALEDAAKDIHIQVFDFAMRQVLNQRPTLPKFHLHGFKSLFDWVCIMSARHAIEDGHNEIAKLIFEQYWAFVVWPAFVAWPGGEGADETACLQELTIKAAEKGNNQILTLLLDRGVSASPDSFPSATNPRYFPLTAAAANDHVSTCELLLRRGGGGKLRRGRANLVWRYVVASGNKQMLELFEAHGIPKKGEKMNLLPIAAEAGQLEMAQWAVSNKFDKIMVSKRKKDSTERKRMEGLRRYLALLLSVVRGHKEIVRWLVQDVGVDLNATASNSDPGYRRLKPLMLAVDAGNHEMVVLLLQLRADPLHKGVDGGVHSANRRLNLERFRNMLHLAKGDDRNYIAQFDTMQEAMCIASGSCGDGVFRRLMFDDAGHNLLDGEL